MKITDNPEGELTPVGEGFEFEGIYKGKVYVLTIKARKEDFHAGWEIIEHNHTDIEGRPKDIYKNTLNSIKNALDKAVEDARKMMDWNRCMS